MVFITGCSRGIGYELYTAFHEQDCRVFETVRDLQKFAGLPEAVGKIEMDVTGEKIVRIGGGGLDLVDGDNSREC